MSRLLVLLLLLVNCAVALKLPARSTPRYEALVGGRPTTAAPLGTPQDIARLIKNSVVDVHQAARAIKAELIVTPSAATRVWLDLNMNQSLLLSFEQTRDDTPSTCTMRVKQTRLADECTLDGTSSESSTCADVGCVAVRWNLATRQGILIDLFKNTKGERIGCDLSSADDPNVPWGQLMLRVVDDIACLLQMQHVFLADEATVPLRVWDAHADSSGGLRAAPMKLQYLHPLVHGIGYYEQHGYYRVPRGEYYGRAHHSGDRTAANGDARDLEMAWRRARSEVEAFRTLRIAPFVDGCFAHAMHSVQGAARCANHRDAPRCRCTQVVMHRGARCTSVHGDARRAKMRCLSQYLTSLVFLVLLQCCPRVKETFNRAGMHLGAGAHSVQ